jgi:hypothetical protein
MVLLKGNTIEGMVSRVQIGQRFHSHVKAPLKFFSTFKCIFL